MQVKQYPSILKLRRIEGMADRITDLQAAIQCLDTVAEVAAEQELYMHGTLSEMREALELAIRRVEDQALEGC